MKKDLAWYFLIAIFVGLLPLILMWISYGLAFMFGCTMPTGSIDSGYSSLKCTAGVAPKELIGFLYRSHVFILFSIPASFILLVVGAVFALVRVIIKPKS